MPGSVRPVVLVLCTANRCRSPLAAAILTHRCASAGLRWSIETAGVAAKPGDVTEAAVLTVLGEIGVPAQTRPARQVDLSMLQSADLVLTAERAHRSAALQLAPALVGRAFTLLEFDRLLIAAQAGPNPERDRRSVGRLATPLDLARLADSARAIGGPAQRADDLADPIGSPLAAYRRCRDVVEQAVDRLVAASRG